MILRDDKFYENGKEVLPQIGNLEQIRLLKEAERKKAEAEAEKKRLEEQRLENERLKKLAQEQEEALRVEREKAQAEAKKVREEFEAKQKEFEAQQKAKAEAERIKLEKLAKKEKVDSFFAKHENQIIEKFTEKANGDSNALQFMRDALDIIKEVMSK